MAVGVLDQRGQSGPVVDLNIIILYTGTPSVVDLVTDVSCQSFATQIPLMSTPLVACERHLQLITEFLVEGTCVLADSY